jgi:hypothetical protein
MRSFVKFDIRVAFVGIQFRQIVGGCSLRGHRCSSLDLY